MIDLDSCVPLTHNIELFYELCQEISDIFVDGFNRNDQFITLIKKYSFSDLQQKLILKYPTDGILDIYIDEVYEHITYCILEIKNEIGSKAIEPITQAIFYWLETICLCIQDRDNQLFSQTNFPAILLLQYGKCCCFICLDIYTIFSIGPHISIAFTVYTGISNIQILDSIVPLHFHPSDTRVQVSGEHFICALQQLLSSLKDYYLRDAFSKLLCIQVKFLFYTMYTDGGTSYEYKEQISEKRAFKVHLQDNIEDKIFVKFTHHYGEDVYETAHKHSFTPKLQAVECFANSWVIVVMDNV